MSCQWRNRGGAIADCDDTVARLPSHPHRKSAGTRKPDNLQRANRDCPSTGFSAGLSAGLGTVPRSLHPRGDDSPASQGVGPRPFDTCGGGDRTKIFRILSLC